MNKIWVYEIWTLLHCFILFFFFLHFTQCPNFCGVGVVGCWDELPREVSWSRIVECLMKQETGTLMASPVWWAVWAALWWSLVAQVLPPRVVDSIWRPAGGTAGSLLRSPPQEATELGRTASWSSRGSLLQQRPCGWSQSLTSLTEVGQDHHRLLWGIGL